MVVRNLLYFNFQYSFYTRIRVFFQAVWPVLPAVPSKNPKTALFGGFGGGGRPQFLYGTGIFR
jgi:hypothetical protein